MDAQGITSQAQFIIPFTNTPVITTASPLPNATQGSAYSTTIAASGGTLPYVWSILSQTGSNGWVINSSTGALTGTPGVAETDTVLVQVLDSASQSASKNFSLQVVSSGGTLVLHQDGFPLPAPSAGVGLPYELGITVTNSTNLISWSVVSPAITASFINQSNARTIFSWPSPTSGAISIVIQATDTVTSNTGTITLNI